MIKITGFLHTNTSYTVVYYQLDSVLNIESSAMCDECIPWRESSECMVWLDMNGTVYEIECIFPKEAEALGDWHSYDVKSIHATPTCKVSCDEKSIEVFIDHTRLFIIFNKKKKADMKYVSSSIVYHVSADELVAIECTDFKLL